MTIWSNIKSFLNSRLGKENFLPLDQMLLTNWKVKPSNAVYYELCNVDIGTDVITRTFEAFADGEINVGLVGDLQIYKNNALIYSGTTDTTVQFAAGDVLQFRCTPIQQSSSWVGVKYVKTLILYGVEYKDEPFTM